MPRKRNPKGLPWYRADRDCWVTPGCKKKSPIRDRLGNIIRGEHNKQAAIDAWKRAAAPLDAAKLGDENEVRDVFELYLDDRERQGVEPRTLADYTRFMRSFCDRWPRLLVRDLRAEHVHLWWASNPGWKPGTHRQTGNLLKGALNWAAAPAGGNLIGRNPLAGLKLPSVVKRAADVVVTDEEFARLLALIPAGRPFRDFLLVMWLTGTRPVNLCRATAADVSEDGRALVLTKHKTAKRKGVPLVVPLPGQAREVVARLAKAHPTGPLFRNSAGKGWASQNIYDTTARYAAKAGLGDRFTPYSCRHTRATRLLEAGVSDVDVAAILGNSPAVIHRHYSHVTARMGRLVDAMERATGGGGSPPAGAAGG